MSDGHRRAVCHHLLQAQFHLMRAASNKWCSGHIERVAWEARLFESLRSGIDSENKQGGTLPPTKPCEGAAALTLVIGKHES